jgi:hypothetical protein
MSLESVDIFLLRIPFFVGFFIVPMHQDEHKSCQTDCQSKQIDNRGKPVLFIIDEGNFEPVV